MIKVNKLTKENKPKLSEIIKELKFKKITDINNNPVVVNGYVSDLLSDVIANADEGFLWITIQKHMNIIAVAKLKKISAVLIVNGGIPQEDVVKKAEEEGVILLTTEENSFEVSGKIYCFLKNFSEKEE